ncbi:MAG: hypothetical protein JO083_05625 [Candidatus Eremiobacteraeota bacterium]|nr:hypothetical protein [Candidatus Eremiobacteraeota bacterium]
MTAGYEPVLRALFVEPRVARPGETVCIEFRARNLGALPSRPATVAFVLAEGLEPLAGTEVAVEPVAPGEDAVARILARVRMPVDDLTALFVQAVLRLDGAELGTNRCALLVRSRPVFDGAASGTFVEQLGPETVRVRTEVTNEGDGPAHGVRVVVPAPVGCARLDGDGPAVVEAPRLDVGQRIAFAFNARVVRPVAEIRADDGEVRFGNGVTCALPARAGVVTEPLIAAPEVGLIPSRRRTHIAIEVRNEGWADAHEVPVGVTLPKGMMLTDEEVGVDGVPVSWRARKNRKEEPSFARAERSAAGCAITLGLIPARGRTRIMLAAGYPAAWSGGTIGVCAGGHVVETAVLPEHVRDVRLDAMQIPRSVAPGDVARIVVRVVNAGDVAESLTVSAAGDRIACVGAPLPRALAPGAAACVALDVCLDPEYSWRDGAPALPGDGVAAAPGDGVPRPVPDALPIVLIATDVDGERARREVELVVRDRAPQEPPHREDALATASLGVDYSDATGAEESSGNEADLASAVLHAPNDAVAGAAFAVRIDVAVQEGIDELVIRVSATGATYVAGTTTLDGHGVLDRHGRSPLEEDGLALHDVPAGTRIVLAMSYLAGAPAEEEIVCIGASLGINGTTRAAEPVQVRVRSGNGFALRPAALAYHVDALTVAPMPAARPATCTDAADEVAASSYDSSAASAATANFLTASIPSESVPTIPAIAEPEPAAPAISFVMSADALRLRDIERLLNGTSEIGLVAHVLVLRALFPDDVEPYDARIADTLDRVRAALHDVFDRLFVKLRIPGFYVAADDLEDRALRSALTTLLETLADRDWRGDSSLARIDDAPYGAPCVLRALVALLPQCLGDARMGGAVAHYGALLDETLARYEGVPLELFEDALTRGCDRGLNDARATLLEALRAHAAPTAATC